MAKEISHTFTLIFKRGANGYTVEASGPKNIRVTQQPFAWRLTTNQKVTLRTLSANSYISPDAIAELGKTLYDAVFIPPIATAYGQAQASVTSDQGMRIQLQLETPELDFIPWEVMYDGEEFIAARSDYPLVRTVSLPKDIQIRQRLQVRGSLRILFVESWPKDLVSLRRDEEEYPLDKLRESLAELISKRRVAFDELRHATLTELREKLLQDYHIVYFAGHGDTSEGIYLEDEDGYKQPVSAQVLAQMIEGKSTRLVFLNACHTGAVSLTKGSLSSSFARTLAVKSGLPAVVAMQYQISDEQAVVLESQFFESLAASYSVEQALSEARKALIRNEKANRDVISPVMYLMAKDGRLFRRATNWARIGFAVAFIAILAFIVQTLVFTPDREDIRIAQQTAQAESTIRANAQATAQIESTRRIEAQSTAQAEAAARADSDIAVEARRLAAEAQMIAETDKTTNGVILSSLLALESSLRYSNATAMQILRRNTELLPHRLFNIKSNPDSDFSAVISSDGKWIAVSNGMEDETTVAIWEVATNRVTARLPLSNVNIMIMLFSPDGSRLVTTNRNELDVWDVATGTLLQTISAGDFQSTSEYIRNVAFLPESGLLVTIYQQLLDQVLWEIVQIWDPDDGSEITSMRFNKEVIFDPSGQFVAGVLDNDFVIREVATGHQIHILTDEYTEYTPGVFSYQSGVFSYNGEKFAVVSKATMQDDRNEVLIRIWDISSGELIENKQFEHDPITASTLKSPLFWSENDLDMQLKREMRITIFTDYDNQILRFAEADTGEQITEIPLRDTYNRVDAISPDERYVVISEGYWDPACEYRCIEHTATRLFDMATAQQVIQLPPLCAPRYSSFAASSFMQSGAFMQPGINLFFNDGEWLAVDENGWVWEWIYASNEGSVLNPTTNEIMRFVSEKSINSIAFSPDSQWLAIGGDTGIVNVWEVKTGAEVKHLQKSMEGTVLDVSFSQDGGLLAASNTNRIEWEEKGGVTVWDTGTFEEIVNLKYAKPVRAMEFFGRSLLTLSTYQELKYLNIASEGSGAEVGFHLWDIDSGQEISQISVFGGTRAFAMNADHQLAAVANTYYGGVWVWDLPTKQEVFTLPLDQWPNAVALSPDGQLVAIALYRDLLMLRLEQGQELRRKSFATNEELVKILFSPNGEFMVVVLGDRVDERSAVALYILNTVTSETIFNMDYDGYPSQMTFSPNGRWIAIVPYQLNPDTKNKDFKLDHTQARG